MNKQKKETRRTVISKDNYEKLSAIAQYKKLPLPTMVNVAVQNYIHEESERIRDSYRKPTTVDLLRKMSISYENIKILAKLGLPVEDIDTLYSLDLEAK